MAFFNVTQNSSFVQNTWYHSRNTWYHSRSDALFLEDADLVGIERLKMKLMNMLLTNDSQLRVISVVGMGGLGKTTLVKKVYDDAVVKNQFKHHVWVTVSQPFKIESLLKQAIQQLFKKLNQPPPAELDTMDINSLKLFVLDLLHEENYILVFGDISRITDWDAIRMAFPKNNCGSRIMITTRITEVGHATMRDVEGVMYHLQPLTKEESWTLFCKKAFRAISCPHHLEEISENIMERCAGLPLAIVVIAGVLATKSHRTEEWDVFNKSLSEQLAGNSQLDNMTKLLCLSYYDLPIHLRICLLYLSIFPEDVSIKKKRLVWLWIAEGFVQTKEGMTREEVAEGYLNELIKRSLVQIAEISHDGRVKACCIHDIIQQIILRKARELGITTVLSEQRMQFPDEVRRLTIHSSIDNTQVRNGVLKYLRSLILLESIDSSLSKPCLSKLLSNGLRLLKVLDLRGAPIQAIPCEMFTLIHLKYLSLRNTNVKIVPKSIGKLQKLEILHLKNTNVTELPVEILKLQQLRHLLVFKPNIELFRLYNGFKAPYKMGKLQSLQSLCYIDADQRGHVNIVKEIGKLTQLWRLGITNLRVNDGKELCSSLEKLTNLLSLHVHSFTSGYGGEEFIDLQYSLSSTPRFLRKLILTGPLMEGVPRWIPSLRGLTKVYLARSGLRDDSLQLLQDLPNLMDLTIADDTYEEEELCFQAGGFPGLKTLRILIIRKLKWVKVEKGAMPFLQALQMVGCISVEDLPMGIEHLKNLQILNFIDMSNRFVKMVEDMAARII